MIYRAWVVALVGVLLAGTAERAEAIFRFDEIEPRPFAYNDEYFINIFSYRIRPSIRWKMRDAAMMYGVTAGSLRNDELYLDQRARIRTPLGDHLTAQYELIEWEDYDNRFQRNEVELLFRFLRPEWAPRLSETLGRTPPADGLFFGGWGMLDADKEFADMGFVAGYRNEHAGLRLNWYMPDFFFNGKNKENADYTTEPLTIQLHGWLNLLEGDLQVEAWFHNDLPLRLVAPQRQGGLVFRYHQLQTGFDVRWIARHDVRVQVDGWAERTRKRRRAFNDPNLLGTDDVNREALRAHAQVEVDVTPLLASASRRSDTWVFGLYGHALNEITKRPRDPLMKQVVRRGEVYAEVAYIMALPTPHRSYDFGLRLSALGGFLSMREVKPDIGRHRVTEKLLAKLGLGLEAGFLNGVASGFFQFTFRADDQTFGGGNAQVVMRF